MAQCEITHIPRQAIDIQRAKFQHSQYERAVSDLGCQILRLPEEPGLPDSVFVEDTAIVLDEDAIVTRPGAESRRGETKSISRLLSQYRDIMNIEPPGTLDGGDVLQIGRTLFVGITGRSNVSGVEQLTNILSPYKYRAVKVSVTGCLHLKSAVTYLGKGAVLINRAWVDEAPFKGMTLVDVDPGEPYAANTLLVGDTLIYPATFPKTYNLLKDMWYSVLILDVSELQKAEGAVTCCCLVFPEQV